MLYDRRRIMNVAWTIARRFAGNSESWPQRLSRALKLAWEDAKRDAQVAVEISRQREAKAARFAGMTQEALHMAIIEMRNTNYLGHAGMQELAEYEAELTRREAEEKATYYPAALAA